MYLQWKSETLIISAFFLKKDSLFNIQTKRGALIKPDLHSAISDLSFFKKAHCRKQSNGRKYDKTIIFFNSPSFLPFLFSCIFELCHCSVGSVSASVALWCLITSFVNSLHSTSSVLFPDLRIQNSFLNFFYFQAAVALLMFALRSSFSQVYFNKNKRPFFLLGYAKGIVIVPYYS